MVDFGNQNFNC